MRKTRSDCTVGAFEKKHGLPAGTIRNPNGRDTRGDKKIWNERGGKNMSFGDVIKGVGWVAGKVLQGTAWVASEVIREGIGADIYGSVKDGIQNADDANESIDNILF